MSERSHVGDELARRILSKEGFSDSVTNDLLDEVYRGYPVEKLAPLLKSDDDEVVKAGIFIVSELGARGRPLLADVAALLSHASPVVRMDAIDSLMTTASETDGATLAKLVALVADDTRKVRWKVNQFLMRASIDQLRGALASLEPDVESAIGVGLRALLAPNLPEDEILLLLGDDSALVRKFGLAAVLRRSRPGSLLIHAVRASSDLEVREFGEQEFKMRNVTPSS